MRAASDVCATYGILTIPPGMTKEQAILGLALNIDRQAAKVCVNMMSAVGLALSGSESNGQLTKVLEAAGFSKKQAALAEMEAWKRRNR